MRKNGADLRICNGNFNLHTRFNCNGGNLLDHIRGAEEVNNSFVDTKLKSIPCVGTCIPRTRVGNLSNRKHFALLIVAEHTACVFDNFYIHDLMAYFPIT